MMDSVKEEQSNHQQQQAAATRRRPPRTAAKRKSATASDIRDEDAAKRKKTFDDFFNFCNFVLAYEEQLANSEPLTATTNGTNSAGESSHSTSLTVTSSSSSNSSDSSDDSVSVGDGEEGPQSPSSTEAANERLEYTSDDESWNLVTCFCRRPFAGRPMIECNQCSTWVHLFCAKIKKEHVPEVYICPKCRASNTRKAKRKRVKVIKSVDKET